MAASATASNLESLPPARPPTPPRETHHEPSEVPLRGVLRLSPVDDTRKSLHTPPNAPTPTGVTKSSTRTRKKVEWSSHTEYKEPPQYRHGRTKSSPLSALSSATPKPIKGILKPSPSPNPLASSLSSQLDGLDTLVNITEMLDSTIKQLAGSDRDSRLDAYTMLARALKASNNLPDRVALQDKMSLFMQFIQRDVVSKNANGSPDYSLINHALNLLITFLHFQAIASTLTSDFGVFIIDHCIRCFDDPATPKDLIRHLMQVAAFQTFSVKVMTLDRVGRLLGSLSRIENHITGKSIVMGRIQIYKRLVKQSRHAMVAHTEWVKDLLEDMLSPLKEIRSQAIALGADAGFALRNEKAVLRKATEIFQSTDGDQVFIEAYMQRLKEMIQEKQCPSAVPQIWSVVILFLRWPLDRWQYFNPWLKLAQASFNTTDSQTKHEANYAWNRFVYLSLIDSKSTPKTLGLLTQPLGSQLRRKVSPKQANEGMKLRKTVIGGVCNLYYYLFRPGHDKASVDTAWDGAIKPLMAQLIELDGKPEAYGDSIIQASRIMAGLFDVSTPRGWSEERVRDLPPVSPEELLALDPKWTRRNSERVFQVVGPIMEKKFIDLSNSESMVYRLWRALVGSIAAASAKDIKVSEDTANFSAYALGLLFAVWTKGSPGGEGLSNPKFLASIKNYIQLLIEALGLLPFTEKKLSMTVSNTFEPIATPSHRPDRAEKPRGVILSPVLHLFSILCSMPPGGVDDEPMSDFIQSVFEPFFNDKTAKARAELAREMLRLIPRNTLSPYGPWVLAAQNIRLPLEQAQPTAPNLLGNERLLGPEYREIVSLLERGLVSHLNLPSEHWFSLFDLLSEHVVQECGDAGRALGIVEPLAKILLDNFLGTSAKPNSTILSVTTTLYKIAKLPRDRQAVEVARRRLWGAPPTHSRASSFDPFDNLYKLGTQMMVFLYDNLSELGDEAAVTSCIEAINAFVVESFSQAGLKTLLKLHEGLDPWIQDDKAQLKLGDQTTIATSFRQLWDGVCGQLAPMGHLDQNAFSQIEPILTIGFKSKHRYFVNKTAETWNVIVKDEEELECSDSLKSIVATLRPKVDLIVPGGEESSGEFGAQGPSFIESQAELGFIELSSTGRSSGPDLAQPTASSSLSKSKTAFQGPMTRKRRREATPEVTSKKPAKRASTPRLRHDNSQIQFAPVESSSPIAEESQHLTERQKEVRQRQQENARIYTELRSSPRSSPRTRSRTALGRTSKQSPVPSKLRHQATPDRATPERTTSYEDYITSTPTPRRGQALHLADDTDPPSSPPEPRRYPLLSEIQTRSKARNSLENWEFSSPPGTPSTSGRQVLQDAELPQIVLTDDSTQQKGRDEPDAERVDEMEIVPSSIVEEAPVAEEPATRVPEDDDSSELSPVPSDPPATPPRRDTGITEVQGTPKSADEEFVDARSSPEPSSPARALGMTENAASGQDKDASFYMSEGEESSMMRFVVELESRRCNLPFDKYHSVSPEKKAKDSAEECILVHTDSSSPQEKSKRQAKRAASPIIPSTPAEPVEESSQSQNQTRRKRRRSAKYTETRRKRRRSLDSNSVSQQTQDSKPAVVESGMSDSQPLRRSPRRAAGKRSGKNPGRESRGSSAEEAVQSTAEETTLAKRTDGRDGGGDTDEELRSQLVAETNAASQSQSQKGDDMDESMDLVRTGDEMTEAVTDVQVGESGPVDEGAGSSKASTIAEILRGGLGELRGAALSREDVYLLEDIMMDMKRELFEAERRGRGGGSSSIAMHGLRR